MTYREVSVIEVKEILRLWLAGHSQREVTTLAGADRKTVRRYVQAAQSAGLARDGGPEQLTDELLGAVVGVVRPDRPHGVGAARESLVAHREQIEGWLKRDLTLAKVHVLLGRRGVVVPYRTLHRYAVTELGFGRRRPTVRVADGDPGVEVQVDFGRLGLIPDPARGGRRVTHGLIFTAVYSRHMFLYPTHRQTLEEVIAGFEAAWAFFDGVFKVIIPDNMKTIIDEADPLDPRFNDAFREYAQARGFVIDPARVRHPRDKPQGRASVSSMYGQASSPGRISGIWPTAGNGPRPGARRSRARGSTAPPAPGPVRCSPPRKPRCWGRRRRVRSRSRPTPGPKSPPIGMSRSRGRSTRCRAS